MNIFVALVSSELPEGRRILGTWERFIENFRLADLLLVSTLGSMMPSGMLRNDMDMR